MTGSRDRALLDPSLDATLTSVLAACRVRGVQMVVYCTVRSPAEQARLWRQSRRTSEVHAAADALRDRGAPWLAGVLEGVGPQRTAPQVTDALPGMSWHQWGLAVDAVPVADGAAQWGRMDMWAVWAEEAEAHGLTPGGRWVRPDWPHVQAMQWGVRASGYTYEAIDAAMSARWGDGLQGDQHRLG